ncbi:hypothetical protein ACIBKY_21980 [Nonomuraea sp. NPDC050394]|uniref:DUF3885 domain-containing protein n=1 Tax=Nonomuraea sp. NPDC050394 TaxID=3364363 RepID=UPI00378F75B3
MTWRCVLDECPELSERWQANWPDCPPDGSELRWLYASRWVRFHSLPESKRYADTPAEYDILLHRHNTVLSALFNGQEVFVVTAAYTGERELVEPLKYPEPLTLNPGARLWMTVTEDEEGEEFSIYSHMLVTRRSWRPGVLDPLLRAVADDVIAGVLITDMRMSRIYHPYDGGADCILESTAERDRLEVSCEDWLPARPAGR